MNAHGGSAPQSGSKVAGTAKASGPSEEEKRKEQRALRPRPKQTAPKVKKRTRFFEVTLGEGDGPRIVGRRIKVFWPLENKFFYGHVKAFNGARKLQHKIVYDDKDEEWLRLQDEVFGIELVPGEVFGETASTPVVEASTVSSDSKSIANDSTELRGDAADDSTGTKFVESAVEGRIKPEGVYRRKRKAERAIVEKKEEFEKKAEGNGEPKTKEDDGGEPKTKKLKGTSVPQKTLEETAEPQKTSEETIGSKKTLEGTSEQKKKLGGTGEQNRKAEGTSEQKKILERRRGGGGRNRGEARQRGSSGRANVKRSASLNSSGRERRKKGVQVGATSRVSREKGLTADGSIDRRTRIGKELEARKDSNSLAHTRTRHSLLAGKEGKKSIRNRIRDNDRLFPTGKSSSAVIRRKVAEGKRSKESRVIGSSREVLSDLKSSSEEKVPAEGEKLVTLASRIRKRKQADLDDPSSTEIQGDGALAPFEAVMDAYREALSGTKDDAPSATPTEASMRPVPEEISPMAVPDKDGATTDSGSFGAQSQEDEDLQQRSVQQLTSGVCTRKSGSADASPVLHIGHESESDLQPRDKLSAGCQRRISGEVSSTEVVLMPLIPPVTRLVRPEFIISPDKVYGTVKKYQPDKVYRRLKHSRNKVHNEGVDEQAYVPQTIIPVAQYWFLARALRSASHVLFYGARNAALGSSLLPSFDRIAFTRLQCGSNTGNGRLQLGTFYGPPSMQSLLRVSWNSLRWLFASVSISVYTVDDSSLVQARLLSARKLRRSKMRVITTNNGFKRRRMSSRRAFWHVTSIRQLLDPTRDLKLLSLSLNTRRFLKGLGVRSRRLGSVLKRSSVVVNVPPQALKSVPQELHVMSSAHLTQVHGHTAGRLYTGGVLILRSDGLRRALSSHVPWISRPRASAANVLLNRALEASMRTWSVVPFPVAVDAAEQSRGRRSRTSCREVGAYYGRRSLQSFLRCTRDVPLRMGVGSVTWTHSGVTLTSVDLRGILKAIRHLGSARGDCSGLPPVGLTACGSCGEDELSILCGDEVAGGEFTLTRTQETPFMRRWAIGAVASSFIHDGSARHGGVIPRQMTLCNEYRPSTYPLLAFTAPCSMHVVGVRSWEDTALRDGMSYSSSQPAEPQSEPVGSDEDHAAGLSDLSGYAANLLSTVKSRDCDSNCKQIGAHYGPPCVESLLRVSKELWIRLVGGQQDTQRVSVPAAPLLLSRDSGAFPRVHYPKLSNIETIDEDEVSDQEDRVQVTSGGGKGADYSYAHVQDPGVMDDSLESSKVSSAAVAAMKKGRRTGKGSKRDFAQVCGDSFERDGIEAECIPGGHSLGGVPYSKRTRVEIENSGAALTKDNDVETSPASDLDGKGSAVASLSGQKTPKASTQPRVNVLKLRRCPLNKSRWLVAGNSCVGAQEKGLGVGGVQSERIGSLDSRLLEDGESMMPVFETSRKRTLDQCLEYPQLGRNQDMGNPAATPFLSSTQLSSGSFGPEITASTKAYSLNSKCRDGWFECGITAINGGVPDGLETRKRRRKGPSPNPGDDVDGISEHSGRRSADRGWGSCTANVLITKNDRCVRETGAVVELQPGHDNSYLLTVFLQGQSRYALKADQPVASGTTNKFTHSMMWRGGKAWSLEFVDRKQWQVFKDLHEECFQRNARAASVRHIPIPGVKLVQECPKSGLRFVRPSLKYIHQFSGEVEMALASTRVIYDMDSEDEEWLNQVNSDHLCGRGTRSRPKIDEDILERVMDKLEKAAFIRQQEPMSAEVAAELCQALGSQDAVKAIHAYWCEKRQRKGMALVRHFQPAPWEQYQTLLRDWQAKVDQLQQKSPTASKQQLQSLCKRPPLFAFCLRPRGLETRNKMQKQRSQRKQGFGGSSSRQWTPAGPTKDFFLDSPSRRHPNFDNSSGPFLGSRRFVRQRIQEDNFSDPMVADLTDSFNVIAGENFTFSGVPGQAMHERSEAPFPQIDSSSVLRFETSSTGGFTKRTKKLGRKAKKMKLLAAAEESRRKRQLRTQQGHLNGRFFDKVLNPHSLSEKSQPTADTGLSSFGVSPPEMDSQEEDKVAHVRATEAVAKAKREAAVALRSRAQALYAVADAAMHKAVAAVIAADAIHAAERAVEEAAERREQESAEPVGLHRLPTGEVPVPVKDWGHSGGGTSFGSWRRALNSASRNANHVLSKGSSSKPGLMADTDDPLLPVASWSQELGAGLGTRLLQTGEVSPQRQRYSPVLVEGLPKSPTKGVRSEGIVSLGRTRGESMMAMLTR